MSSASSQTKLVLDGLSELLACGKCKKTPDRPMRYVNCEHFFCYACTYGETICFKCEIPLSRDDVRPCRMVDQLVDYCRIVNDAIAEIKTNDTKTLSKAIRTFTMKSNGVVPETDSESEDDVVESTPPGGRSSQKKNAQLEASGYLAPKRLSLDQSIDESAREDEYASQVDSRRRKEDSVPETAGYISPTQFSSKVHQRKQNAQPETAGFVSPTQFSPCQRKRKVQPETAGFVSPTQLSPCQRKRKVQPETAGFVSPTQLSPCQRKRRVQPETAGFVSPTQFSPHQRKHNLEAETAGFVSPTQFSPRQRKRNVQPETAGFVSPTQFSPRQRKHNLEAETAGFVSPTQFSPHQRKQEAETAGFVDPTQFSPHQRKQDPETAGFVDPTQFSPHQRKQEPETAGFVDPTQFSPHQRKQEPETAGFVNPSQLTPHRENQNINPACAVQLSESNKKDSEPESARYSNVTQTPPSGKKKHFRTKTCKFLTLRTRQRHKSSIAETLGSYVNPTQRDSFRRFDEHSRFIVSSLDNDKGESAIESDARKDSTRRDDNPGEETSVTSDGNFKLVDKCGNIHSQRVTEGRRDLKETRCPANSSFAESSEIFDFESAECRREIDVRQKVPDSNDSEKLNEEILGIRASSIQESNILALAPESMKVIENIRENVVIPESLGDEASNCRNSLDIDDDCSKKSSLLEFSCDQNKRKISDVVDGSAIQEVEPVEKLRIKTLALKRLTKIRKISQVFTESIEADTRKKRSNEETSRDNREEISTEREANLVTDQTFHHEANEFVEKTAKRLKRTRKSLLETDKTIDSNATKEIQKEITNTKNTRQKCHDKEMSLVEHESRADVVNDRTKSARIEEEEPKQLRSVENFDAAQTNKCDDKLMQFKSCLGIDKSKSGKIVPKNVNKRNAKGETSLHTACVKGQVDYVKMLLEAGANPNTKDNANWTPLQEAVNLGHREICKMLLQAGASANTPAMDNRTALHEASENDRLEEATLLLRYNANKNVYDKYGKKPIDYAVSKEMRMLLADETKIDAIIDNDMYVESTLDQSIIIPNAKVVVLPSNLSSQNRKLLAQLASKLKVEVAMTFRSTVTHVVVETNDRNITELTYDVMLAILQGKCILNSQWITISRDLNDISDIDLELFEVHGAPNPETPTRARINEEKQNPRLFNNCYFYFAISPRCTWSYEKFQFTKESLTTLVLGGQGEILNREPDPEDVKDYKLTPFHVANKPIHPLYRCSHYIIYMPGKDEPRVKYNMPHIKSLPVGWFLECIEKFALVDPLLMGIT